MKDGKWEKKRFLGTELRGKTLGIAGLGRIGQEVAQRARAFGMRVVAHDPYISKEIAAGLGVELMSLDEVCATRRLPDAAPAVDAGNASTCSTTSASRAASRASASINTARGELIDEAALRARDREAASSPAPALDVFETEPPADWSLAQLPQVIATPHIAASTEEAQELVGIDTAATVRDFLRDGMVRNAVNFPSIHPDELQRLQPWIRLADQLGALASQMGTARIEALGVRYYGALAESRGVDVLAASAAAGVLRPILSSGVSIVNARAAARARGIDIVESRSSRSRHFTSLVSIKLHDRRRRALGRRHRVRAEQPAAGVGARRRRRSAARRHDADHRQRRSAGRDRRGRHDPRPPRREHRQLRARPRRRPARSASSTSTRTPARRSALDAAVEELRRVPAIREAWVVRLAEVTISRNAAGLRV